MLFHLTNTRNGKARFFRTASRFDMTTEIIRIFPGIQWRAAYKIAGVVIAAHQKTDPEKCLRFSVSPSASAF